MSFYPTGYKSLRILQTDLTLSQTGDAMIFFYQCSVYYNLQNRRLSQKLGRHWETKVCNCSSGSPICSYHHFKHLFRTFCSSSGGEDSTFSQCREARTYTFDSWLSIPLLPHRLSSWSLAGFSDWTSARWSTFTVFTMATRTACALGLRNHIKTCPRLQAESLTVWKPLKVVSPLN